VLSVERKTAKQLPTLRPCQPSV